MADVRVTFGKGSRVPGTEAGIQVNTFGLSALEGITGEDLAPIVEDALQPSFEQAHEDWPVLTGASRDSMRVQLVEVGLKSARAGLLVGGDQLMSDPRNRSGKDYAPFIEYNGTPTTPPGTIAYAIYSHQLDIRDRIHEGVSLLLQERLRAGR